MKNPDIQPRLQTISEETLARENLRYTGTGGVSANNRNRGFVPAFLDTETGKVYRSRFPNGKPAPVHVLAGLPDELVDANCPSGGYRSIKHSVVSGFILEDRFYSRESAAQAVASGSPH
ncbi:MAG TPA: hypothetical protein VET88_04365 [Gammaproteobacteria bacterium]|nr:hypothetical protein [Gammaproteobacteria bacterium]